VSSAESIGMVGYDFFQGVRRLRLAIARRDVVEVRRLIDSVEPQWFTFSPWETWAALFDGLALLGDRERIEIEAPKWIKPEVYVAPFAVRALGVVRHDPALLNDAVGRFEAMGLDWHAAETSRLLPET
jgi:hypothetical protein